MNAPLEWLNFDASPTLLFEKIPLIGKFYTKNSSRFPNNIYYGNIAKGINLPIGSCKAVYASHVLEHLSLLDFRKALRNIYDLLEGEGFFRLIVPDLNIMARRYIDSQESTASRIFMESTNLGVASKPKGIFDLIRNCYGNSQHLWMWDEKSLLLELSDAGFTRIRRCYFGDSEEPMFKYVEESDRFIDAVAVQCQKPVAKNNKAK